MSEGTHFVPAVAETPREEKLFEFLQVFAVRLSEALEEDTIRHGLLGGTALKIGFGMRRPSTDLDFKLARPVLGQRLIERAIERIDGWTYREATEDEWNQGSEGFFVRNAASGEEFGTRVDLVVGGIHPEDGAQIGETQIEKRDGIWMFRLRELVDYKLNALVGSAARERPRDVYDAAWIMERHLSAIRPEMRTRLKLWHERMRSDEALYARWARRFESDTIGSRVRLKFLLRCMEESLKETSER